MDRKLFTGRLHLWLGVMGLILCLACIPGVSAYGGKPHYDLTMDAMNDEGIGLTEASYVASMNELTDLIGTCQEDGAVDLFICPHIWNDNTWFGSSDDIETLFKDNAHFQVKPPVPGPTPPLTSYELHNNEWVRLREQTYLAVKQAELNDDRTGFLAAMGMSLHTVQDFYAHTDWADQTDNEVWENKGYPGDVTWFDVPDEEKQGVEITQANHDLGTDKDHVTHPHYETSYREAYYGSRQWIKMVKSWVSPGFLSSVTAPAGCLDGRASCSCEDYCGGLGCPFSCDGSHLYMRLFWYTGTWNGPQSKSDNIVLPDPISLEIPWDTSLYVNWEYTGRLLKEKTEYRRDWQTNEAYGAIFIYNQTTPVLSAPVIEQDLISIPKVRWMRIHTYHVKETDCDPFYDIEGAEPGNEADFYSRINVKGFYYTESADAGHDDLFPQGWVTLVPLSMDTKNVWLHYDIWDDDNPDREDDDLCDIWQGEDQKMWGLPVSTSAYPTSVETDGLEDCSIWCGGSCGDGDEAYANFDYQFIPRNTGAAIGLEKTASAYLIRSGDPVTYTYNVTNKGSLSLSTIVVSDDTGLVPVYSVGDTDNNQKLDVGETWTYVATTTLTTPKKSVTNIGTVTATYVDDGVKTVTDTHKETVYVIHPSIHVEKTPSSYNINRGDSVTYTYAVTNTGDCNLTDIRSTDDKVIPVYQSGDTDGNEILDPTETWIYKATSSPRYTVTNTATTLGTDPLMRDVSSTDSVTVIVTVIVKVDIKPGSCPNGFGLKDKGVVPVAILGGLSDYTIDEIKTSSIKLNGVPTSKIQSQDVATPYMGTGTCGCHILTQDSIQDVLFQFDAPKVAGTLSNSQKKTNVPLTLTGTLKDGITLVKGSDCVKIS